MNQFVLAFPIPVPASEIFKLTDTVSVLPEAKSLLVPGCSVSFKVARNGAAAGLSDIFKEHRDISGEEASAIDSHKSLLFLLGTLKNTDDLRMVNTAILKLLSAGAAGVYMQHSGTAWTADAFREELGDGEFPMDPWINFVENADTLYTLGLEVFNSPDLCIAKGALSENALRDVLAVAADSIFSGEVSSKSGTEIDAGESVAFVLRSEIKNPFPKDSPEYNRQGIMRLIRK
ncbi:hypothetical protein [Fibrobacter sp. UBA3718]|uniref:hypothetical protein n=1 Tax=Fibrobacter sp. UBA3718 TaxID=1946531 RepID=UPI0025BD0A64|nr:hypothetical protein [Fibrobacter sp. UBA3718]